MKYRHSIREDFGEFKNHSTLRLKTQTQWSGSNAENTLTIASPNKKYLWITGYIVAWKSDDPKLDADLDYDIHIEILDEDDNVLWLDTIHEDQITGYYTPTLFAGRPARFVFPKPLKIPAGKDAKVWASKGGGNIKTLISVTYEI